MERGSRIEGSVVAIVRREVEGRYVVTEAEREVADLLPIEVDPDVARATVKEVPFWFHTFALNRAAGIYTPGVARDHRYREPPGRALRELRRRADGGRRRSRRRGVRLVDALRAPMGAGRPHTGARRPRGPIGGPN
ncbi:MAG: hypothetical protein ACJ76T_09380 [Solirubrobacteraceae bacterium]